MVAQGKTILCGWHSVLNFVAIWYLTIVKFTIFVKMLEKYKKHSQFVVYSKLGCGLSWADFWFI